MDVTARIGTAEISPDIWSKTSLRPHSADQFTVHLSQLIDHPAETWARAIFGDVPDRGQRFIFHTLLRYRLTGGPSSSTIAGWPIVGRGETWVRLENQSASTVCHLIVDTDRASVSLTTLTYYRKSLGAWVWRPLSRVHRRLAPGLLRDAVRAIGVTG
ncbi:hypothetical protein [Microbacterium faecale]|uniref:hypothetical protein n=1 Tax=Microbacterium faecale TaxID=1804630 RepID=UPI001665D49E|nr:hypothetical protein [Microbacterium faecale]